jgi:hypothetical protein
MTGARRTALALLLCLAPRAAPAEDDGRPVPIAGPDQARRLCAALQLPERVGRTSDPEARDRIEGRQEERRAAARDRQYLAELEGRGLHLAWDGELERLALTERAALLAAGGALSLWVVDEARLPVEAGEGLARRILGAQREGALRVRLLFGISDDDELSFCSRPTGAGQRTLGVVPVAWWYLAGEEELARGGDPAVARAPARSARGKGKGPAAEAPGRVALGDPVGAGDGAAVRRALEASLPALRICYQKARAARPDLEGTLAVELELGAAGGAARSARVALDALMDKGLERCALQALSAARFPAGPAGRVQVPLRFGP